MEESNSFNCMIMDDDDTEETISLNDLRLMYAKLQEIHSKDSVKENELEAKLAEMRNSSIENKASRLRDEVKEIKERIELTKKENKILSEFNLDGLVKSQDQLSKQLDTSIDIMENDLASCTKKTNEIIDLHDQHHRTTKDCQTDLTFPPSFTSFTSFTITSSPPSPTSSLPPSSSEKERPYNAQDAFIEIQMARKRQLEDQLKQLRKQIWFDGPEVMLVKSDAYEKLLSKANIRRRKRLQLPPNHFDRYLELSNNLEKRPCRETSRPPSPSSSTNNNGAIDDVVQLFFTSPSKQTNGQGSHI